MSVTSAAVPVALLSFADAALALDDSVARAARQAGDALAAYRASAPEFGALPPPVEGWLAEDAAEARSLDTWVGLVGRSFQLADSGVSFLGGIFTLLLGGFPTAEARTGRSVDDVAAELRTLLGLDGTETGRIVQPRVDPRVVRAFVRSLDAGQLAELTERYPELVGPVDGMPYRNRYEANAALIRAALEHAEAEGDHADAAVYRDLLADPTRQFLFFDPAGDGRIAEVFGDLDLADHVAVTVPGINNQLANFDGFAADAERLFIEVDRQTGEPTAVVAWLGYDTPGLVDAPLPDAGEQNAPLLDQLMQGLSLVDRQDPSGPLSGKLTTTVIAHSYGSYLTGRALAAGMQVDNVVTLGSPGMGVSSAGELGLQDGTQLFALRAPGDFVSWSESFGSDPSDPRFGGTRLTTGSGADGLVTGHSAYYMPDSDSLANLALVSAGLGDQATVRPPTAAETIIGMSDDLYDSTQGPIDGLQEGVELADDGLQGFEGWLANQLPDPLDDLVEFGGDVRGTVVDYGRTAVDFGQRVTSPDFIGDVVGDLDEMGVLDQVEDVALDVLIPGRALVGLFGG